MIRPWLRYWAMATIVGVLLMLTLGALVTSFRAGMADNTWPRTPWHLFVIEWKDWSLFIEHTHRFVGQIIGCMTVVLAIGLWMTQPRQSLRITGLLSLSGVLCAGALGMWLARTKQAIAPAAGLANPRVESDPSWFLGVIIALAALSVIGLVATLVAVFNSKSTTRWHCLLVSATLVCVLIQGLLGGFRVKLDAMFGADFAATHGAFGQVVLALTVLTTVLVCRADTPDARRMHAESMTRIDRWAMWAAVLVFAQVLAGVLLRHSQSTLGQFGPRLHLWLVFPAVIAICVTGWRVLHTASPASVRRLAWLALGLVVVQVGLGIESWLMRFAHGFAESALRQITVGDAIVRTAHSVVGYGLFGTCVALASQTRAGIVPAVATTDSRFPAHDSRDFEGAI